MKHGNHISKIGLVVTNEKYIRRQVRFRRISDPSISKLIEAFVALMRHHTPKYG